MKNDVRGEGAKAGAFRATIARHEGAALKAGGVAALVLFWELAAQTGVANPLYVSSPSRILAEGAAYISSSQFLIDAQVSSLEFFWGFGAALIVGTLLGFALAKYRRLELLLDPILNFLYASPRIALAPLFVLWFGIGIASKVAIIFLMGVFPIIVNTTLGVRSVDRDLLQLAQSFNANRWQVLWTVIFPSALPSMVAGVRLAIGVSFIGIVVGEFVASTAGFGYTIQEAAGLFQVDKVFVGVFIIGGAGVLLTELLRQVENRLSRWRA